MSENKHSPEPWRTDAQSGFPQDIHDADGNLVAACSEANFGDANARRIVACVNRLAAYKTSDIEDPGCDLTGHGALLSKLWRVEKQRDELLSDVERCYKMLLSEPDTKGALFKAENILREAIASTKESK